VKSPTALRIFLIGNVSTQNGLYAADKIQVLGAHEPKKTLLITCTADVGAAQTWLNVVFFTGGPNWQKSRTDSKYTKKFS
jgi:hypothetical protein